MTLSTLLLVIALVALVLTGLVVAMKRHRNIFMSFVQNFVGALFVFSGWVKAVDPLGTAYKMEQYFAEFETAFGESAFSFMGPLFPWLAEYSISFSVFMIVLEIVLGIMIVIGAQRKFAFWLFLIIILFFAFLTGFTYLTGYVPTEGNFFDFSSWGAYDKNNMRVTDCGCFGDFIKLEPKVSFLKDIFLLVPGLLLIIFAQRTHQLFSKPVRTFITLGSTVLLLLYCMNNYVWNLPHTDFRDFKNGVNVRTQKAAEETASINTPMFYNMTNKETGEKKRLEMNEFLKDFKKYPKEEWEYEQERGEPSVPQTKISEFSVESDTSDMTDAILNDPGYHIMIVAHKLPYDGKQQMERTYTEMEERIDTIMTFEPVSGQETPEVKISQVPVEKSRTIEVPAWDTDYVDERWKMELMPFLQAAQQAGVKTYAVTNPVGPDATWSFQQAVGTEMPFYHADDILLKTIVRSNPGIVLWHDGSILQKWHINKLPDFEEVKGAFIE